MSAVSSSNHEITATGITPSCLLTIQTPRYQRLYVTPGISHGQPLLNMWAAHKSMETEEFTTKGMPAVTAT